MKRQFNAQVQRCRAKGRIVDGRGDLAPTIAMVKGTSPHRDEAARRLILLSSGGARLVGEFVQSALDRLRQSVWIVCPDSARFAVLHQKFNRR